MLNFDLEYNDWTRMTTKQQVEPLMQLTSCAVMSMKKKGDQENTRVIDTIIDGIYFFGGKNNSGQLQNKLRYVKPIMNESKIMSVEWHKIK
jgi:hypothetical protein